MHNTRCMRVFGILWFIKLIVFMNAYALENIRCIYTMGIFIVGVASIAISDEVNTTLSDEGETRPFSREAAENLNIFAIAARDFELSRILNAESDRLKYVLETMPGLYGLESALDQALQINKDIRGTLRIVTNMQMLSLQKLSELL